MTESENQRAAAVLHTWVTPKFAREVRELADLDGRSVSNLIKVCLRDRLQTSSSSLTTTGEDAVTEGER